MSAIALRLLDYLNALVLGYFVLLNAFYLLTTVVSFRGLRRYGRRLKTVDVDEMIGAGALPPITVIAPAYNESAVCVEAARSLLTLRYPDFEVIVVNDGSKDDTLQRLINAFDMAPARRAPTARLPHQPVRGIYHSRRYRNLWVIDKENGGKADTLNAGLSYCRTPLFCAMDADSLLERDALVRIVRPFLEDRHTVAAGGIIRIVNDCTVREGEVVEIRLPRRLLARIQVLEYLRAFLAGRMGWAMMRATLIISGAFGLFRRSVVVEAGGFATDTVGEDMELVVRLHRHCRELGIPYSVTFVPDPVAWTECPETVRVLGRQRRRWQRGLTEVLTRHRRMLFNPRYGVIGLLAYPYFFVLEMAGPMIEVAGYVGFSLALLLGRVNAQYALAFFLLAFVLGAVLSVASVALEELTLRRYARLRDIVGLMALACLEPFGYRQLNSWWRVMGLWEAARGRRGWGEMTRRGFSVEKAR
ncbi:MAG TPA: glycosyltransferase [Gemmatimonadales bacterium]|nr:glycosyltransferase [Gemmatimonadales bacterium]